MATVEDKTTQDPAGAVTVPPYFSFNTLTNQLDFMKERGVPERIDRTFLVGMSGAAQTQYMTGLRSMNLIDAAGVVQPILTDLVNAAPAERKRLLSTLLKERYAKAVELGTKNATTGQLVELFREEYGATGDTARKAIAFYLKAARYVGDIPLSPLFQTPKVSSSGTRKRVSKTGGGATEVNGGSEAETVTPPSGGGANLHPALAGVLSELPKRGQGWTQQRRDGFMQTFEAVVNFTIPIVDDEPQDDDGEMEPEDDLEA